MDVELAEFQKVLRPTGPIPTTVPTADPAARHRLRVALDGTTWKWPDPKLKAAWCRLNPDGTLTAGWHGKACLWTVSSGSTIKVQVTSEREVQELRVDLKAGTMTEVRTKKIYRQIK